MAMFNNPYYPATYNPYQNAYQNPYQNVYQQYTPTTATAVQSVQPSQSSIIWISGEREALAYPVAPNNAVTLWSQSEPVVYLKQADATGKPTLKVYDLVERQQTTEQLQENKSVAYATKDEVSAVLGAVHDFDGVINAIKADIDSMKSDIYGIAGKKKMTAKKQEVEDDE